MSISTDALATFVTRSSTAMVNDYVRQRSYCNFEVLLLDTREKHNLTQDLSSSLMMMIDDMSTPYQCWRIQRAINSFPGAETTIFQEN